MLDGARQPTITVLPNEVRVGNIHFDDGTGQIAEASGTLALRAPASSSLNVSVRGLDLLPIEELAGQEDPEFAGLLNGVARITGPAGNPDVLGSFAIASGRFRELQFARVAGAVHYDGGRIGVDVVVEQAPGVTLAVNGTVPMALFTSSESTAAEAGLAGGGAAPIDLNIESSAIGLQIVTGLTRGIEQVTGTATVKLHVTGTADNPLFDGGVALNGGAFTVPATGRRYRDLTTRVTFEPGRMKVDDLKVLDEEGDALEVSGVLGLRRLAFGDVEMHAQARRFGFVRNDLARLEVDLDLDVTGQVTRPTITGKAVIEQGRVEVDRVLASLDRNRTPLAPDDGVPVVGKGQKPAPPPAPRRAGRRRAIDRRRRRSVAAASRRFGRDPPAGHPVERHRARHPCPDSREPAAARPGHPPRFGGRRPRRHLARRRRRLPHPEGSASPDDAGRHDHDGAWRATSSYGRRFEILRDGRIQFTGGPAIDPALDVTARCVIEPSGSRRGSRPGHRPQSDAELLEHAAARRVGHPRADHLQPRPQQPRRLREGHGRHDGGHGRRRLVVSPLADTLGRKLGLEEIDVQTTNDAGTPAASSPSATAR